MGLKIMSEFNKIYDEYMKINSVTCSELAERISYKVFAESFWKDIAETELLTESVQKDRVALIESNLYNFAATITFNKLNKFFEVIEEGIFDKVGSFAKGFNKAVGLGAKALASGAVGAVKAGYNVAKGITKAGASIAGIFLPQSVKNLGAKVVSRVKQGIIDAFQHIKDAAKNVVNNLKKVKKDIGNSALGKEVIDAMKKNPTWQNLIKKLHGNADDKPRTDLFGAISKTLSDSKGSIILSIINILIGIYTGKYAFDICVMIATAAIPIMLDTGITFYKNKTVEIERVTTKATPPVTPNANQQSMINQYSESIKSLENTKAIAKAITTAISLSRLAMRGWQFFTADVSDNTNVPNKELDVHHHDVSPIDGKSEINDLIATKKFKMPSGFIRIEDNEKPKEIYDSIISQAQQYKNADIETIKEQIKFDKLLQKNIAAMNTVSLSDMKNRLAEHAATYSRAASSSEQADFSGYGIRTLKEKIAITPNFYNSNSSEQIAKSIVNATKNGVDLSGGKLSDDEAKNVVDIFKQKITIAGKIARAKQVEEFEKRF